MPEHLSDIELSAILLLNASQRHNTVAGESIGQEQLIALAAGDLSPRERQEMLVAVAADDSLYHRWLGLLEISEELGASIETGGNLAVEQEKPSFFDQFAAWWSPYKLAWFAGPVLAASVIVMMLPMNKAELDAGQLYARWEQGLQPSTAGPYSGFRGDTFELAEKNPEQQWFEWGVYSGLERLGEGYVITGLPDYKLQNSRPDRLIPAGETLSTMGAVTALTYFYCRQNMEPAFLEDALGVLRSLGDVSEGWSPISAISIAEKGEARILGEKVCTRTNALIKKLILLNG